MTPQIICKNRKDKWIQYKDPVHLFSTSCLSEVLPLLNKTESYVESEKLHAVGFISYEAASAFDSALTASADPDFPLIWFGLYHQSQPVEIRHNNKIPLILEPGIDHTTYIDHILKIKEYIRSGDTYQVNYTYPMRSVFDADPQALFWKLALAQPTPYTMFIETDDWAVCSVSPELFFSLEKDHIKTRPMKGTRQRGFLYEDDLLKKEELFYSEKDRAENLMIVDMIRNDLGRVAKINSVEVDKLFSIEKYPTVWQMTSEITATTNASITDIMQALFPCASITGAPKPRTMALIQELEQYSRKLYTGCMGQILPGRYAQFSVAIRMAMINKKNQTLEYGVGGGIVHDSDPEEEYAESIAKASVTKMRSTLFQILETMLWEPEKGYFILPYHIRRMKQTAMYFDYSLDETRLKKMLHSFKPQNPELPCKIRILLSKTGQITFESYPILQANALERNQAVLAKTPVSQDNVFLYHKTTAREVYTSHLNENPDADDVLLWNERNELTESCSSNIVVERNDRKFTPPVQCGLLGGTYRAWLLDKNEIEEKIINKNELFQFDAIYLINSVRQWQQVTLLSK